MNDETATLAKGPRLIPTTKIIPDKPEDKYEIVEMKAPVEKSIPHEKAVKHSRSNICSVHRMRKVYVSKYKWRCRK